MGTPRAGQLNALLLPMAKVEAAGPQVVVHLIGHVQRGPAVIEQVKIGPRPVEDRLPYAASLAGIEGLSLLAGTQDHAVIRYALQPVLALSLAHTYLLNIHISRSWGRSPLVQRSSGSSRTKQTLPAGAYSSGVKEAMQQVSRASSGAGIRESGQKGAPMR